MKKNVSYLILLLLSASIFSCKKDFATFQRGSYQSITKAKTANTTLSDSDFKEIITPKVDDFDNISEFEANNSIEINSIENSNNSVSENSKVSIFKENLKVITPNKITEKTGKVLTFKQIKELKKIQKQLKKDNTLPVTGGKSQLVALLLAIFVGVLGIHRFYLGYTSIGIIQLLTAGGCGVWALIDLIQIAMGTLKPKDGDYDEKL